jgi:glycogen phosphorylase
VAADTEHNRPAGYEASGASNMKFMMNGAMALWNARDGSRSRWQRRRARRTSSCSDCRPTKFARSRPWRSPYLHYQNEPETRAALDPMFPTISVSKEPGIFEPLRVALLTRGDQFMLLADLTSYPQADGSLRQFK